MLPFVECSEEVCMLMRIYIYVTSITNLKGELFWGTKGGGLVRKGKPRDIRPSHVALVENHSSTGLIPN